MDIVTRLRQFMEYRQIPITQFADTCNIPRPTMSQLLNGRNKKVSDELIGKIHEAYPSLSVLWLMFGEGDMLTDANIKTSEPQNEGKISFAESQSPEQQDGEGAGLFAIDIPPSVSEKSAERREGNSAPASPSHITVPAFNVEIPSAKTTENDNTATISFNSSKRIVNIIVVYSDTTVESFVPASSR